MRFDKAMAVAATLSLLVLCGCGDGTGRSTPAPTPADSTSAPAPTPTSRPATTTEPRTSAQVTADGEPATVASITDGDTFRTTDGERVRLIGIDTPEVGDDACFAAEATAALTAMIPPGTEVRLVIDVDRFDRYGRVLAYVLRASDGLFVNRELALGGYAVQLTIPPNVARAEELGAAVAEARAAGRGLWGGCGPAATAETAPPPAPTAPPAPQPVASVPAGDPGCDPSYPTVCIAPAPPDLDCPQIPYRRFTVIGPDPHGFDGDHDGIGCESG